MQTLKSRFCRVPFKETSFDSERVPDVLVSVPVEENGCIVEVATTKPYEPPKSVPYDAFTAAKVYELGDVTPIQLYNNMSSAEHFEYVKKFESRIDSSMAKLSETKEIINE